MFNEDVKDTLIDEIIMYAKDYDNWYEDDYDNLYRDDVEAYLEFNLNGLDYFVRVNMGMYVYLTHYPGDYLTPPEVSEKFSITIYGISIGTYNESTDEDMVDELSINKVKEVEKEVNKYINRY